MFLPVVWLFYLEATNDMSAEKNISLRVTLYCKNMLDNNSVFSCHSVACAVVIPTNCSRLSFLLSFCLFCHMSTGMWHWFNPLCIELFTILIEEPKKN